MKREEDHGFVVMWHSVNYDVDNERKLTNAAVNKMLTFKFKPLFSVVAFHTAVRAPNARRPYIPFIHVIFIRTTGAHSPIRSDTPPRVSPRIDTRAPLAPAFC